MKLSLRKDCFNFSYISNKIYHLMNDQAVSQEFVCYQFQLNQKQIQILFLSKSNSILKLNRSLINFLNFISLIMNFLSSLLCCCQQTNSQQLLRNESTIQIYLPSNIPLQIKPPSNLINMQKIQKCKQLFIDQQFPPNNQSLGHFLGITRQITWKRISQMTSHYCLIDKKKDLSTTIIASTCTHSYITIGLLSLALNPNKIFDIFGTKFQVSRAGIYKLAVKYKGVVQWILIDDFIPVFSDTGRPLICGLANQQIWVMLICKVWAKIRGSYSAIDDGSLFDFICAFSPAACFSYMINSSNITLLKQDIELCLRSPSYSICSFTSPNPKKGLLSCEYYAVRGCYDERKEIGQMMAIVNGQIVSANLSVEQLLTSSTQLIVSKKSYQYIIDESKVFNLQYRQPLFLKIRLEEPVSIILNFSRMKKMHYGQQYFRVLFGKKIDNDNYTYVASKLQVDYLDLFLDCGYLLEGEYLALILLEGPKGVKTQISATTHRRLRGQFTVPRFFQQEGSFKQVSTFLKSILIDYSKLSKAVIRRQIPNSGSQYFMQQVYYQGGFGYLVIKTYKNSHLKHEKVKINMKQIQMSKYELFGFNQDSEFVIERGKEVILVFLLKEGKQFGYQDFPPGISIVQVF